MNVVKKPKKQDPSPVDEDPVQYEEVDVDEANPEDDKYDPNVCLFFFCTKIKLYITILQNFILFILKVF